VQRAEPCQDLGIVLPADSAEGAAYKPALRRESRVEALTRSFWLVREVQAGDSQASAAILLLIQDAERRGWPEVVLAGLYAACVVATVNGDEGLPQAIERLLMRAEADADLAMMAMALALRARIAAVQRASAHNSCAIVYGLRRLWELQDQQYVAAEALLPECEDSPLPSTVLFNRAELQLDWACAMREIGDAEGIAEHCRAGAAVSAAAKQVVGMPEPWRHEMLVSDVLLAAVGGADVADEARALLVAQRKGPDGTDGYLHLAIALSPGPAETTAEAAERAVATIDGGLGPTEYDLALRVAAEMEAAAGDGQSAGLRCAVRQIELRWSNRLSTLAAMEALLQVERLRTEHDKLSRHANLDDLTGLSNRRGLHRYLAGLQFHGGRQLALLVVDIDGFKQVNDRHGHSTGDDTLVSLAAILTANIRPGDLAVRLGGDEFALVLADTDLIVAARRADDIVTAMKARPWHHTSADFAVTVSVGLASGHPEQIDEITARADAAMYQAKAAGGSRAICS
jgi:diguanylate cyclase (GGDEF)-like protein